MSKVELSRRGFLKGTLAATGAAMAGTAAHAGDIPEKWQQPKCSGWSWEKPAAKIAFVYSDTEFGRDPIDESEALAPLSLLAIALGNLLKNALSYAEGHIEITLHEQVLTISNPTAAAPDQILGYGCGLTIIQRICEKLGWQIETRLEDGIFSARLVMIPGAPGAA